jgi:hypothetical protein
MDSRTPEIVMFFYVFAHSVNGSCRFDAVNIFLKMNALNLLAEFAFSHEFLREMHFLKVHCRAV